MNQLESVEVASYLKVPLAEVQPDSKQPRTYFKPAALNALAASIKTVGQRTPIEVRRLPKGSAAKFEIIDGERRWRACQLAGVKTIRVCIEEAEIDHRQQHHLSLVSNFLREGHTHVEISNALQYQVECQEKTGGSRAQAIKDLMENLGRSEAWVWTYLSLQKIIPRVQEKMHPDTPDRQLLRFGEANVLAQLPDNLQWNAYRELLKVPVKSRLKRARDLVQELTGVPRPARSASKIKRQVESFVERLSADMERILELKQSEFHKSIGEMPTAELELFQDALKQCGTHLKFLSNAIERVRRVA